MIKSIVGNSYIEITLNHENQYNDQIKNGDIKGDGWYSKELSLMVNFKRELVLYQTTLELLQRVEQKEREYNQKM